MGARHSLSSVASAMRASVLVTTTVLTAVVPKWVRAEACRPIASAAIINEASSPIGRKPTPASSTASMRIGTAGL